MPNEIKKPINKKESAVDGKSHVFKQLFHCISSFNETPPENEYSNTRRQSLTVRRNPLGVVSSPSRAEHSSQQQQSRASVQPRTLSAV